MVKFTISLPEAMMNALEEEMKKRRLDSIQETIRSILSDYFSKAKVFRPTVEVVYAPREKPLTEEELKAIYKELGVGSMDELLDKVLKGEVKSEEVKRVYEELMMKRRKRRLAK